MTRLRQKAFPSGLIQVAGIHDFEEAEMVLNAGVDMIGLPLRLTVNQEDLSEQEAVTISRRLRGRCCLITYLDNADAICEFTRELGVDYVQLHGPVDPLIMPELRRRLPRVHFIKSLVVGKGAFAELIALGKRFSPHVWAFITDTYDPETGAEGATGKTHDWCLSKQLVQSTTRPVILAGGLNPLNVSSAVQAVGPMGVDVHSGVEGSDGRKDPALVKAFVNASRSAFQAESG